MEVSEFEDLLDLHGGDLAGWPAAARAQAEALLAASPEARRLHDDMLAVETVLRCTPAPSAGADAIAARATRHRQETPARRLALRAGWAVAAMIVLAIGLSLGAHAPVERDVSPARMMASALDGGVADVE